MPFVTYRATKDLSLGQLRKGLRAGDLVEFDGVTTRVHGQDHRISTLDAVIQKGWLVPLQPPVQSPVGTSLAVGLSQSLAAVVGASEAVVFESMPAPKAPRKPQEPNHASPAIPGQDLDTHGNTTPFGSPEAARASGKRPMPDQKHVWDTGWLNHPNGEKTCKVCGVTEEVGTIRADRVRGNGGKTINYRDMHGNAINAFEELSCPVYLGDAGSAAAYAKDQVRKVRGRVDDVEDQMDAVGERLAQLEADNEFFRNRLLSQPVLDAQMVAEALLIIAGQSGTNRIAEKVRAMIGMDADILRPVLEAEPILIKRESEDVP